MFHGTIESGQSLQRYFTVQYLPPIRKQVICAKKGLMHETNGSLPTDYLPFRNAKPVVRSRGSDVKGADRRYLIRRIGDWLRV